MSKRRTPEVMEPHKEDLPRTLAAGPLLRLVPLVRPYAKYLIFGTVISLGSQGAQVAHPQVVKRFVDDALRAGRRDLILPYALVSLGLGLLQGVLWFLRRNAFGYTALGVENDLRNRLYAHLQRLHVGFHDGWQSGQLVSRAVSDISRIRRFLGFGMAWLFLHSVLFVWVIVMLFPLDAVLALATVVFSAPVAWISYRFGRQYRAISKRAQDQQGDLTTIVEESATGVRVVKAFGRMPERSRVFRDQATTLRDTNVFAAQTRAGFWAMDNLLLGAGVVTILLLGGPRVVDGAMTLGGLVAFVSYQLMLTWPVRDIGWIIANAQEAFAASDRVYEILDTPPDIDDEPGATAMPATDGSLRFEHVDFVYPGTEAQVLRSLDLHVEPGETLALVGMTGCGKTTVASLVPRFYDPLGGRVTLDGRDIRSITLESLRSHVGVAFEDPILFSVSVRENLLMGRPSATDDELWEALRLTEADGFVRELPWGLDTRVGEQGYSLSGGQRQRLALARAVVGEPAILVLDDPLSSVDVHTEAAIEASLGAILRGRTSLLIAHRPSTVLLADRVALLHEGRIVATGTHHDLLEEVPLYREVLAKETQEQEEVSA